MDLVQANDLARRLMVATVSSRWDEPSALALVDLIAGWDDDYAAELAIGSLCNTWAEGYRPTHGHVIAKYREALALRVYREPADPHSSCDGTRWNDGVPCPRCNPYLHDVYQESEKWAQFLRGVPLHVLHEGVRLESHRLVTDSPVPPACLQETRYDENGERAPDREPPAGGFAAWRERVVDEYLELCEREGRAPNQHHIDAVRGGNSGIGASLFKSMDDV